MKAKFSVTQKITFAAMVFEFDHSSVDKGSLPIFKRHYSPRRMKECLFAWQRAIDWNANYFENHDQLRSIERYGEAKKYWKQSGKMLATLLLTLRGTPYIYMDNGKVAEVGTPEEIFSHPISQYSLEMPLLYETARQLNEKGYKLDEKKVKNIDDLASAIAEGRKKP